MLRLPNCASAWPGDAAAAVAIDRLAELLTRQEDRVEQFKSINALLQNSLAYFALFSASLTMPSQDSPLAGTVSMLATAMLRLTLDTSPTTAAAVQTQLDRAGAVCVHRCLQPRRGIAGPCPTAARSAPHGRRHYSLVKRRAERARPDRDPHRHPGTAERAPHRHATLSDLLYVTSLCLVGSLIAAGWQLQLRNRAMRRRAAFEHVLAAVSMRFVTSRAADLGCHDRCGSGTNGPLRRRRARVFRCGRSAKPVAPMERAGNRLSSGLAGGRVGVATARLSGVRRNHPCHAGRRLRSGADRDALAAAGLQGWACVVAKGADGNIGLLGFDAVTQPCRIMREGELGLLRMALDVVANARDRRTLEQERTRLKRDCNRRAGWRR